MNETTPPATELAVAARNEPTSRVTQSTTGEAKAVAQNRVASGIEWCGRRSGIGITRATTRSAADLLAFRGQLVSPQQEQKSMQTENLDDEDPSSWQAE